MVAGAAAPLLLGVVFAALTVAERSFLDASGWSPVHRSEVEWPSLLELGPHGWLMQVALVIAAVLGVIFAVSLFVAAPSRSARVGAVAILVMSIAVAAMALPPDHPGVVEHSWHDVAHNAIYPAIPLTALVAGVAFSAGYRGTSARFASALATVFVVIAVVALALSTIAGIAQLMRFVFFGALLAWLMATALTAGRSNGAPR